MVEGLGGVGAQYCVTLFPVTPAMCVITLITCMMGLRHPDRCTICKLVAAPETSFDSASTTTSSLILYKTTSGLTKAPRQLEISLR
jgi:hypothetical protein